MTERELDFARKHEEDLQRIRGFRLLDDDFMSKVFEDKGCTELLLQIILGRTDLKVRSVVGQYDIKNLQGRSIRLDILAVDTENKVYNIEIQRSDKGTSVKRVRYFKEDEEGVQTMCRALEEMREEVREEERIKAIRCMIQFEIPKEKILSKGYSEEEYKVAKEKI